MQWPICRRPCQAAHDLCRAGEYVQTKIKGLADAVAELQAETDAEYEGGITPDLDTLVSVLKMTTAIACQVSAPPTSPERTQTVSLLVMPGHADSISLAPLQHTCPAWMELGLI